MSIDKLTAAVYDPSGTTLLDSFTQMNGGEYRDEITQRGNGKLRIPLDDAEHAVYDNIIKFSWRGGVRFGCIINNNACELAVNGRRWLELENLPGLLALLDQADIEPEYGLGRRSGDTRWFGYMSKLGAWLISGDWLLPQYVLYNDEIAPRKNHPPELKPAAGAPEPAWISALPGPDTTVATGTKNWFRYPYTVADDTNLRIVYAGDNYTNAFHNGEQKGTADQLNQWGWRNATSYDVTAVAGDNLAAFDVENAPPVAGHTFNPVGLMVTAYTLNVKGEPDGVLWTSNPVDFPDWRVCKVKPGWHKGYLIGELLEEAQAQGIPGANALAATFTDTHDSNGNPWDDDVDEYAFDIATMKLADVITSLCESGINVHVNAATMEIDAYNRMGTDRYSTVEYKLAADGGSLTSYKTTGASARATSITAHIEDGTWVRVEDSAGIAAIGRRKVGLALGTAPNTATATAFARAQLAETAKPQHQFTAKASTQRGPQFYNHLDLGDSVKGPADRGAGTTKIRALAVTVSQNGQKVDVTPDFMEDLS